MLKGLKMDFNTVTGRRVSPSFKSYLNDKKVKKYLTGSDPNCRFPVTFNSVTSYIIIKFNSCKFNFWNYHKYLYQKMIETNDFLFVWMLLKVDYIYAQMFFSQFFYGTLILKIFFHVSCINFIMFSTLLFLNSYNFN